MYLIIAVYCRFLTGRKWGLEFAFHEKTRGLVHGLKSFLYPHDCCAAGLCLTQVWKLKSLEGWVYGNILRDLFLRSCQTDGWAGRIILIGLIILCLCIKHIQNRFLEITISYTRYRVQYLHASFVLAILGAPDPCLASPDAGGRGPRNCEDKTWGGEATSMPRNVISKMIRVWKHSFMGRNVCASARFCWLWISDLCFKKDRKG